MLTRIRARLRLRHGALLALASASAACVAPITEVLIVVDSDIRDAAGRAWLSVNVQRRSVIEPRQDAATRDGARPDASMVDAAVADSGEPINAESSDAGRAFSRVFVASAERAEQRLPASFAVLRPSGWSASDLVHVSLEVTNGERVVRRQVQFSFTEGARRQILVYLSARCSDPSADCGEDLACTVQQACERRGQTCDRGACVDLGVATTPLLDAGAEAATRPEVGAASSEDVATDIAAPPAMPAPRCGDAQCDPGESACACAECAPRAGDNCCSPGESVCSEPACAPRAGDNCCSAGESVCSEPACAPRAGDNCCSAGENHCGEPACPAGAGDGCCSSGEAICRGEPACGARSGDGCCTPGEPECNCRVSCCDGYSEGPIALSSVSGGACASHFDVCNAHGYVRTITFSGAQVSNGTNRCWAKCSRRAAYHQVDGVTVNCRDHAMAYCAADSTRGSLQDAAWQPCQP